MTFLHCILYLTLTTLFLTPTSAQTKCRALVLQGGGDKGAYETGVLNGFIYNTKNPEDFQYDVITGISVGALNGICLAQFAKGDEISAAEYLTGVWNTTKRNDVYVNWPGGILEGLMLKSSLFNNNPEMEYLNNNILKAPNLRKMTMVATDINTGAKIIFDERDWNNNESLATKAALYSSAVPVVFMDRDVGNHTYIDGGWSGEGLDVEDAIARCLEIVDDEKDIIIDAIIASNISNVSVHAESYTSLEVLFRYHRIQSYMASARAITYGKVDYPDVDFRYVMIPSLPLPNQDAPLDFDADNIKYMIELGQKDAIMALKEGPEAGMKSLEESMKLHRFT